MKYLIWFLKIISKKKYTFDFKITASSQVLINIEQIVHSDDHLLPLRIYLAKIKEENSQIKRNKNKATKNKLTYIFGRGQAAKKDLFQYFH